jgi:hypothetical protein
MNEGKFTNFIEGDDGQHEKSKASITIEEKNKMLKRVRRSLNESQTFADMLLSTAFFMMKVVSAVFIFVTLQFYLFHPAGGLDNFSLPHDGSLHLVSFLPMHWVRNDLDFSHNERIRTL